MVSRSEEVVWHLMKKQSHLGSTVLTLGNQDTGGVRFRVTASIFVFYVFVRGL